MLFLNQRNLFLSQIKRYLFICHGYCLDCTFGLGNISAVLINNLLFSSKLFVYERNFYLYSNFINYNYPNVFFFNTLNLELINLKLEHLLAFAIVDIGFCDVEVLNKRALLNFLSYCDTFSVIEALNFFASDYVWSAVLSLHDIRLKSFIVKFLLRLRATPVLYSDSFLLSCGSGFIYFRKFIDIVSRYSASECSSLVCLLKHVFVLSKPGAYIVFICFNSQEVGLVDQFYYSNTAQIESYRTFTVCFSRRTMAFMKILRKQCL